MIYKRVIVYIYILVSPVCLIESHYSPLFHSRKQRPIKLKWILRCILRFKHLGFVFLVHRQHSLSPSVTTKPVPFLLHFMENGLMTLELFIHCLALDILSFYAINLLCSQICMWNYVQLYLKLKQLLQRFLWLLMIPTCT